MHQVQLIELLKVLDGSDLAEDDKHLLASFVQTMSLQPSYARAGEIAKLFGKTGPLARMTVVANIEILIKQGMLNNPVSDVYGLSPSFLASLGLFRLPYERPNLTTAEIWNWVEEQIDALPGSDK